MKSSNEISPTESREIAANIYQNADVLLQPNPDYPLFTPNYGNRSRMFKLESLLDRRA